MSKGTKCKAAILPILLFSMRAFSSSTQFASQLIQGFSSIKKQPNGMHSWFWCLIFGYHSLILLHIFCSVIWAVYTSVHIQWAQCILDTKINHPCHLVVCQIWQPVKLNQEKPRMLVSWRYWINQESKLLSLPTFPLLIIIDCLFLI